MDESRHRGEQAGWGGRQCAAACEEVVCCPTALHVPKEEATQGCQGHHPDKHVAFGGVELEVVVQLEGQQRTELVPLLLLLLLAHPASCVPLLLHS